MTGSASLGWEELQARQLEDLDASPFEEFCGSLVRFEAYDRHDDPEVGGGAGSYRKDAGRDLILSVSAPPVQGKLDYQRQHKLRPLTEDPEEGGRIRVAYSCKTGAKWLDLALRDGRQTSERPVEVLAEGGYFKLLINRPGKLDNKCKRDKIEATPHEHLRRVYWERLRALDPKAPDPGPRIQIRDANDLASWVRARQPEGGDIERWADEFGISPLLRGLEEWRLIHREERAEPAFEEDPSRRRVREELLTALESAAGDNRLCIVGRPGVGKTRLVIETIASRPRLAQRVRVALTPTEAGDAIDHDRLLRRYRDAIVVVDDCLVGEARDLASRFRAAAQSGARPWLILLVPAAYEATQADLPGVSTWSLDPLDDRHRKEVLGRELGRHIDDPGVVAMARLSEGYPWFLQLLAQEFRNQTEPPRDMREAVRWALASSSEANNRTDLEALRLTRAKTLLCASLTRSIDWNGLSDEARQDLARAVALPTWADVITAALACDKRGILRRRLSWQFKYVTPEILEREVIAWLLGPDGPDPGGRTLTEFAEPYLDDFFNTMERLGLPADVLAGIANTTLHAIAASGNRLADLDQGGLLGARLRFAARRRPGNVAQALWERISTASVEELHVDQATRRRVVWTLEEIAKAPEGRVAAEASLFRLARAENEAFGNNATAIWTRMVATKALGERGCIALLRTRLTDSEPDARVVALHAVPAIVGAARPNAEIHRQVWALLAQTFDDAEPAVATKARRLGAELLRAALRSGSGLHALRSVLEAVDRFDESARAVFREHLDDAREYDGHLLGPVQPAFDELEHALAPQTFRERLRHRVSTWGPASLRDDDEELDDAVAREGLEGGGALLRAEFEWLLSQDAQRTHVFAYAIGRNDLGGLLFEELRRLASDHPQSWKARALLARYVGGVAESGRELEAGGLVRQLIETNGGESRAALAIVEVGATPATLPWLEAAFRAGAIDEMASSELGRRRDWLMGVDDEDIVSLASAVLDGAGTDNALAALEILVARFEHAEELPGVAGLLERAASLLTDVELGAMADHSWTAAAKVLIRWGGAACVAPMAVSLLSRGGGAGSAAWKALHAAAEADPVATFQAVARGLDTPGPGGHLQIAFYFHRRAFQWPLEEVLRWVGDDERRARVAASIVRARGDTLPDLYRALVRRFGPRGPVARELMARIMSTEGAVASLAENDQRTLERARRWCEDPDDSVAEFSRVLSADLEREHERHAAYEEEERRRFGT